MYVYSSISIRTENLAEYKILVRLLDFICKSKPCTISCASQTAGFLICSEAARCIFSRSQPDREAVPSDVTPEKSWKFLVFCLIHRIWGSPPCAIKNLEAPKGACPCHCITHARNARASGTGPSAATAWKQNT